MLNVSQERGYESQSRLEVSKQQPNGRLISARPYPKEKGEAPHWYGGIGGLGKAINKQIQARSSSVEEGATAAASYRERERHAFDV